MHVLCSLNDYAPADSLYSCAYNKGMAALFELNILDYKKDKREISCRILKDGEELYGERDLKEDGTVDLHPTGPGRYQIIYRVRVRLYRYYPYADLCAGSHTALVPAMVVRAGACCGGRPFTGLDIIPGTGPQGKVAATKAGTKICLHELEAKSLLGQLKPHLSLISSPPCKAFLCGGENKRTGLPGSFFRSDAGHVTRYPAPVCGAQYRDHVY